jgi:class 3 adenylate cyclase/FixJ family two-component response regulator
MSLKVLVVDNKPESLASLIKYLAQFDFMVYAAAGVAKVLAILEAEDYGVVMIDVNYNEMNAFELAGVIKDNPDTKDIPIIFITDGSEKKDFVISGLQAGGVDFIPKPFDVIVLMLKIRNFLMFSHAMKTVVKNNKELSRLNSLLEDNINYSNKLNRMLSDEKQRSDDLLLNILPAEVADELKEKGKAGARYFGNVTVLFTDFVAFTKAGERLSPQELVSELDTCFQTFDIIMGAHNIEKIKTNGDSYLAVAGVPAPHARHAHACINAALEIVGFMKHRKAVLGDKTFDIRIGIHSGNVVAGIVGLKKFAFDIWGDTVNTAARLEEKCAANRINISDTTYQLVKDEFKTEYRGAIEAKNKGPLKMYYIADDSTNDATTT